MGTPSGYQAIFGSTQFLQDRFSPGGRERRHHTPSTSSRIPLASAAAAGLLAEKEGKMYSKPASVWKTISSPRITVGRRWLAIFQHSALTHEQSTAIASTRTMNTAGRGPKGAGSRYAVCNAQAAGYNRPANGRVTNACGSPSDGAYPGFHAANGGVAKERHGRSIQTRRNARSIAPRAEIEARAA